MSLVERYRKNGYVVLPDAVKWIVADVRTHLQQLYDMQHESFRNGCRTLAKNTELLRAFLAENIRSTVEQLGIRRQIMQTQPVCHAMGFDRTFDGVAAHQDYPAIQSSLNAVTVWMPMHDVGLDDYPVEVVPGSHLLGLLPAKSGEHYSEVDAAGMEFVPVAVPFGAVLLFSVFTVHRTRTPGVGTRVAFSHRYEDAGDPTWFQRGCPSAQKRVIDREVRWTPTIEQVRAVFA